MDPEDTSARALYWTAAWCGYVLCVFQFSSTTLRTDGAMWLERDGRPCKAIGPEYEKLNTEFPNITFGKVDIDQLQQEAQAASITSVPSFSFFKHGTYLGGFSVRHLMKIAS